MRATDDGLAYLELNRLPPRHLRGRRPSATARDRRALRDAFEAYLQFDAAVRPDPRYFARAHAEHEAIGAALRARAPEQLSI